MAPRPNWKGYLKLSLVSCPVALYTAASTSERTSFHMINRQTENRLRRQMVDSETGDVVEDGDIAKGFEVGKNKYIILENEELEAVALESTHTIDIDGFVPRQQVDEVYIDQPYYLVPDDAVGEEAFSVIRAAMEDTKMVGLARVVLYRREHVLMLEPRGKGILATTLRYDYEVRDERKYFGELSEGRITKEMLDLAKHIIATKKQKFDPSRFEDRYEEALRELIKAKRAGHTIEAPPPPKPSNVINLMDALRRSVAGEKEASGGHSTARRPRRAAPTARKTRAHTTRRRKAG
jgi:DNA end-binding protein Ku